MNVIDRAINYAAPRWGWRRQLFRRGIDALSNYEAGSRDRLQPGMPINATAERTDAPDRDILRARARYLERNSDIGEAVIGAIIRNVVGTGIIPQPCVRTKNGDYDEAINRAIEEAWSKWGQHQICDMSRQSSIYEFQQILLRRRIVDGESFCRPVIDKSTWIPLRLQGLEADMLAASMYKAPDGNYIISGVEVDQYYAPIAYWFQQTTPDGFMTMTPVGIPADEIIHLYFRTRFTQVRGISELAAVMKRIRETGEYLDARLLAEKIAACFAVFVKKQFPGGAVGRLGTDAGGKRIDTIEPGIIEYLQPGEDISTAMPGRDATTVKDFIQIEQRLAAAGKGMSYEVVSRDMSESNYSSARQNSLEDRKTWLPIQYYMVNHFCRPIHDMFIMAGVLAGKLNLPGYWSDPDRYQACNHVAPGWVWIDPLKDVQGSKEELRAGLNTAARVAAEQGLDWREMYEQRAREMQYAKELGLDLDIDHPAKAEPVAAKGADDEDAKGGKKRQK